METLIPALVALILVLAIGALAQAFGAESRDGLDEGNAPDPSHVAAGVR
jgi:hypothetical protein